MNGKIYVEQTPDKGRGVFALITFSEGDVIEVAPFIKVPGKDYEKVTNTVLNNYWYDLNKKDCAVGLGYTSLYNHANEPNATYVLNSKNQTIKIVALKDIVKDQEITIDYGYDPAEVKDGT